MARKGSQQKNGLDHGPPNRKTKATDPGTSPLTTKDDGTVNVEGVGLGEELSNGTHSVSTKISTDIDHVQEGKNSKKKSRKSQRKEKKSEDDTVTGSSVPSNNSMEVDKSGASTAEASNTRDEWLESGFDSINSFDNNMHREEEESDNVEFPETPAFKFIRTAALSVARSSANWVERHKPTFATLKSDILKARDQARMKFQLAKPIVFRWIVQIGNIILLLFMVWLDCTIRGIDSFLRMGTTSFFSILWCSVLSLTALVGIWKVLLTLAASAAVGLFLGFTLAVVLTGVAGIAFLWIYGSFWTTGLIIFLGGLSFITSHDRIALFITSVYSIYLLHYEVVYLIHEDHRDEVEKVNTKVREFLEEKKGKVWRLNDWGMRRLAYKIQKAKNAHYILMNFEVEAMWINDFKSMLDKDERVIHHLVMKQDKAETRDCPPPPEFHSLRGDMTDDADDDDEQDYEDEDDEGVIYVDDVEMTSDSVTNTRKPEKVGR